MAEERELILKLGQKITDRIGVKVTTKDPEYWGLAGVITDEMAEVALSMKVRVPATAPQIAKKCGKSLERTEELLQEMSVIGLIEYNWENKDHVKQYILPMFVPGCAEFMMMNEKQVEEHPELADFFENMSRLPLEKITPMVPLGGAGIGMHVIPVEQAIPATQQSVSVEHISYWLKKYENKYAVGACSCRRQQRVRGEGTGEIEGELCIGVGDMADYLVETGKGRYIDLNEVLEILQRAEDNGFVHQITNIDGEDKIFAICNCAPGVCNALRTSQLFNTPNLSRSAYRASVESDKCVACGRCVEFCPTGAAKLGQKLCTKDGPVKYPQAELPDAVKWSKEKWDPDYRDNAKINCDIFIPQEFMNGAVEGSKVVVSISDYGSQSKNPQGKVTEVLGHIDDPGVDIMSIIKAYDLPVEFPESVKKAINDIPDVVSEKDKAGRVDLRNVQMVTIDGEDAKDLDDAVSISKEGPVYHLGVHIADVSHYVTEGSALDKEALKRGTSVYLVDRVIPMIPHKLSNGICSLNQGEDRLALSCLMDIDEKGNIVGHRICETVINVDRRMSYTSVKKILVDNDTNEIMKYKELVPMFHMMEEAAELLRKKRFARGSVDFDFPESKIILDENGHPTDIKPYDRNVATKIIEDFMLAANETVAEDYFWQDMPFLYRTHENPDPEKMRKLATFINNFGYTLRLTDDLRPKEIQKLLSEIEGSDAENLISRLTLRSMKKAKYTTECVGHFGLAAKYYCHFTSPIRRYPDLQIHRIIKENLHGGLSPKRADHYDAILPDVAVQTSAMERRAADAERDTDKLKMAEYMEQFVGEIFEGVVSGVTAWGVYVELPNTIEGMVSVNNMKGFYTFDEEHYEMVGELGNRSYKLGQKVKVVVIGTDKILRTIDFAFA